MEVRDVRFLLLVHFDETYLDSLPAGEQDEVWREAAQFHDDIVRSGQRVSSGVLRPTGESVTVRVRDGRATAGAGRAVDGEPLGGFVLVEAADMDEAVRIAERTPGSRFGSVEIRPVRM